MSLMDCLKQEYEENQQHFHVLAVDDSKIDRKLLERLLTVSSYQVTCVDSGDKALEYLGIAVEEENEYKRSTPAATGISCAPATKLTPVSEINLIMTDYSMPGISGYDLLKRIKDSSWKHVPVVVMSSENEPSRINMCLEGGAEEFLLKPVKLSDLRKIHSHLQSSITNMERTDNFKGEGKEKNNNCSNTNKRKAAQTVSSEVSSKRPRVQNLH